LAFIIFSTTVTRFETMELLLETLLDFDAVEQELFPRHHPYLSAVAARAGHQLTLQRVGIPALAAYQPGRAALEMQLCAGAQAAFADHIPIELDRVVHDARQLPNDNVDIGYPGGLRLAGVADGDLEDIFGNG
jgi:hypothetical protein